MRKHGFVSAFRRSFGSVLAAALALATIPSLAEPPSVEDLPINEIEAVRDGDWLAIIVTGDGGWAGLAKTVGQSLAERGIEVVGLNALRYFWQAKTPEQAAADLDRLVGAYLGQTRRSRVVVIGYSFGADVLPFMVNRLPAATRERVATIALIGLSSTAEFEFHIGSWLGHNGEGRPVLPEVERLSGKPLVCIYGADETDSLCPSLPEDSTTIVQLPGNHHYDRDYEALADAIWTRLPGSERDDP